MLKRIAACILVLVMVQIPAVLGAGTDGVTNGSFDSAEGWSTSETAIIENGALRLTGSSDVTSSQLVKNILGENTYTFTGKFKTTGNASAYLTAYYRVPKGWNRESYTNTKKEYSSGYKKSKTKDAYDVFTVELTPPKYTTEILLQLRKVGKTSGDVYWDDVSLTGTFGETPLEENPFKENAEGTAELKLDEVFYYTDKTTATATVKTGLSANKVIYTLYEGKTKKWEKTENYGKAFSFSLSALKEETQYKLSVLVKNGTSKIAEGEQIFYRVKRPTALSADGSYHPITVDPSTGEVQKAADELKPVMVYSIFSDHAAKYTKAVEGGITVVQGYPSVLDKAKAAGVKVLVVLYSAKPENVEGSSLLPAGHPNNVAATRATIRQYKNHEAVFGWLVVDEPQYNMVSRGPKFSEALVNSWLLNSYRVIHEEDPHHPVFVMQDSVEHYGAAAKAVDILGIDPYINTGEDYYSDVFRDTVEAVKACKNEKPVYALVQAMDFQRGFPTPAELRHMVYQAKLAGAKGFGYYEFDSAHKEVINGTTVIQDLPDTVLWPTIMQIKAEKDLLFGLDRGELRHHGVYGETEDGKGVLLYMGQEKASVLTATYADSEVNELIGIEFTPISETEKMAVFTDTANKKRFIWTDGQGLLAPGV